MTMDGNIMLALGKRCEICGKRQVNQDKTCSCEESDKELFFDRAQFDQRYQPKRRALGNGAYKILKGISCK